MRKIKLSNEHFMMSGLKFNEDDLAANREGYMSQAQRERMRSDRASWFLGTMLSLLAWPGASYIAIADGIRIHDTFNSRMGILALITALSLSAAAYCWQQKRHYDADLYKSHVEVAEGRIRLDIISQGKSGVAYTFDVADAHFEVSKNVFLAFKNGDPYAVYYAPHTHTLLSAEWLRES